MYVGTSVLIGNVRLSKYLNSPSQCALPVGYKDLGLCSKNNYLVKDSYKPMAKTKAMNSSAIIFINVVDDQYFVDLSRNR